MSVDISTLSAAHRTYSFGEFTLDLDRGTLLRSGADLTLRPKSFAVLCHLVQRSGLLVTKSELLDAVWGRTIVTEDSVAHCVSDIRKAIGDHSQEIIRTVPRRGYIFDVPVSNNVVSGQEPVASSGGTRSHNWPRWLVAVPVLLVLGTAAVLWSSGVRDAAESAAEARQPAANPISIAVLPFSDMSPEQDQAYLADGVSEDILNRLAGVPGLRVISRSSAFSFRGANVEAPTVARQLDVSYVVEGSVRAFGEQLRVTAQLIDARSDTSLWSATYNRELGDVLSIQSEIATSIADSLSVELLETGPEARPIDSEAYRLALRAKYFWNRKLPDDQQKALRYYQQALEVDPAYAPAWAGLSASYLALANEGRMPREEGLEKAREAARTALSADPGLSDAHVRMGMVYMEDHNRAAAFEEYRRAQELDPNNPVAMAVMAVVWLEGRLDEGIEWYRKAAHVDPLTTTWPNNMAYLLIRAGRLDEAEQAARQAMELGPSSFTPRHNLAVVHLLRGQFEEALEVGEGLSEHPEKTRLLAAINHGLGRQHEANLALQELTHAAGADSPLTVAEAHARCGNADQAFEWLNAANAAHLERFGKGLEFELIRTDPFLQGLQDDHRWIAFLERLEKWE